MYTLYIYNVFTIPDSADLDILTFIKSLHWFNELSGLSDIFLTKYVLYFTINSLCKASYAKLANPYVSILYTTVECGGSTIIERLTLNRGSPCKNPFLLPFPCMRIFVLSMAPRFTQLYK